MLLLSKENDEIKMRFILWIKRKASRTLDQEESGKIYLLGTRRTRRLVVLALLGDSYTGLSDSLNLMASFGRETERGCDFSPLKMRQISFIVVCQVDTG